MSFLICSSFVMSGQSLYCKSFMVPVCNVNEFDGN